MEAVSVWPKYHCKFESSVRMPWSDNVILAAGVEEVAEISAHRKTAATAPVFLPMIILRLFLPVLAGLALRFVRIGPVWSPPLPPGRRATPVARRRRKDRKSTRLNSSHSQIS